MAKDTYLCLSTWELRPQAFEVTVTIDRMSGIRRIFQDFRANPRSGLAITSAARSKFRLEYSRLNRFDQDPCLQKDGEWHVQNGVRGGP